MFDEEEVEEDYPIVQFRPNPEFAPMMQELARLQQESPSQYETDVPEELKQAFELTMQQGVPIEPVVTGYGKHKVMKTVLNHPTAEVWEPDHVVIDPSCNGDVEKAGFVVFDFESSLSELKKDGRYKNLDQIQVSTNSILGEPDRVLGEAKNFNFRDKPRQKFVVYEYWGYRDIDGSGVVQPIVASWVGNTLIRLEKNPYPDKKLPIVVEQYLPVRKSTYGEPDGALLEDNQKVVGAVTRGMIDIMGKSANGQTGIRKDMLDATNRRKFEKGMDYEFNQNVDPRQGVYMHTYPEIPASAQFMLQLQNMEAESITGVKSFSSGVSGASLGDVAAGVRGALDAASKRELGILRRLSNGLVKVARKWISMNSEFLSPKEVIRVTNDEFVEVRRDDLAGAFDLRLSISTAEEDNNKAEQLAFMLQTVGPQEDPMIRRMLLADICRLRKMPDIAKRLEAYEPQPDPLQQRIAELEIAKLEAEIAEINARAMQYQSSAQLDMVKAGTEVAKQDNIQSDTDLKNLDFVEQESGVKQERDLQKQGEQARAQAQLAVTDHTLQMQRDAMKGRMDLVKEYVKAKKKQ
jgi:hypothetical protein